MTQHRQIVIQILICLFAAMFTIYAYIEKQNSLTELRLMIPVVGKEVRRLTEENIRLRYEIEQFESPVHLMELARKPEFGHLKYPSLDEILEIKDSENPPERIAEN
jgi:hypothetical protein